MIDEHLERGLIESNPVLFESKTVSYVGQLADDSVSPSDCSVCLCEHDEEIHAATLSVRGWFRDEVTKSFRVRPDVVI